MYQYFFVLVYFFCSLPTLAKQFRPEVLPVKIEVNSHGNWHIVYHLPCESQELGLFISQHDAKTYKIGILTARYHERCAGIGSTETLTLEPMIATSPGTKVIPFNPALEPYQYQLISPEMISYRSESAQDERPYKSSTQFVYTTRCGPLMGIMISLTQVKPMIAMVESKDETIIDCEKGSYKMADISSLLLQKTPVPFQYAKAGSTKQKRQAYRLTLAPIKKDSLRTVGQEIHFEYLRHCHQSPIGVVTRNYQQKTVVAMLLADYPKSICSQASYQRMWSSYRSKLLAQSSDKPIVAAKITRDLELGVILPQKVQRGPDQSISLQGFGPRCPLKPLMILADQPEGPFIGFLTAEVPGKRCKKVLTELSLSKLVDSNLKWSESLQSLHLIAY